MKKILICVRSIVRPWIYFGITWLIVVLIGFLLSNIFPDDWGAAWVNFILSMGVYLIVLHPIMSLICSKRMYADTCGSIWFVFYQGVVFAIEFCFLTSGGLFLNFSNPDYLRNTIIIFITAILWGIVIPLGYYIYKKVVKQEKTN